MWCARYGSTLKSFTGGAGNNGGVAARGGFGSPSEKAEPSRGAAGRAAEETTLGTNTKATGPEKRSP